MKTPILILSALLLGQTQSVLADAIPTMNKDANAIIQEQLKLSEGVVDVLARDASHQNAEGSAPPPPPPQDYVNAENALKANVDAVMARFRDRFEREVLKPELAPWIARFNQLMAMTKDPTQRKMLRDQRLEGDDGILKKLKNVIIPKYHEAIAQVYDSFDLPWDPVLQETPLDREQFERAQEAGRCPKFKTPWKSEKHVQYNQFTLTAVDPVSKTKLQETGCDANQNFYFNPGPDGDVAFYNLPVPRDDDPYWKQATGNKLLWAAILAGRHQAVTDVYQKLVFPIVKEGCQNQVCLALRAADLDHLILSINEKIDRTIDFKLANDEVLTLPKLDRHVQIVDKLLLMLSYPEKLPEDPKDTGDSNG